MIMCEHCHIGRLHGAKTAYLHPLGEQMLVFPVAPALLCDVCGRAQFDPLFIDIMEALISDHLDSEHHPALSRAWAVGERYQNSHRNKMI